MTSATESYPRLAEGKTKIVYQDATRGLVLIRSKDDITAGDGARRDRLEGKAVLATATTAHVFHLLNAAGLASHFIGRVDEVTFRARHARMVPIEVVVRRIATGSYLKRHPETAQGTRFVPALVEYFLKDDARHDPLIFESDILGQALLDAAELEQARHDAVFAFEVLERAWGAMDVTLVDMKVEFGRLPDGALVLADVVDNDSWRIWPGGNPAAMKDKQVYRNLSERTPDALAGVLDNYRWVAIKSERFLHTGRGMAVVVMGSDSDAGVGREVRRVLGQFGVETHLRVCSAHKDPQRLLELAASYDAQGRPVVYVAVAGRSNGLGPVLDGATANPVVNCPPQSESFGGMDVLSSLRLPGGLACTTVLEPETAALAAVKALSAQDPALYGRLRLHQRGLRAAVAAADARMAAAEAGGVAAADARMAAAEAGGVAAADTGAAAVAPGAAADAGRRGSAGA